MNHCELLENALLDAFSLLDEDEREAFDRAFAAAPPHIQAQIRLEQTRFAKMESLLPEVAPPASLRARVLDAIRAAAAERSVAEAALALRHPDTIARLPAMAHKRKVAAAWRALALACAAAAIVLGVTTVQLQRTLRNFDQRQDVLLEEIKAKFGPNYLVDALVDSSTQRITLASHDASQQARAQAAVWYNPDWRTAKLFGINLPAAKDDRYRLVVLDDQGNQLSVIAEFTFRSGLLNEEVPVTVGISGENLAIVGDGDNGKSEVLLAADTRPEA
ncbi:MAG: hypothetical protein IPJ41_13200 [Phycisphaerales bacterium]|nr:hypothetical protein [Phycisphaerales bacterium]